MKLGLFGGTFNPIHFGHLILAEEARTQLKLDKIFFIPAGNPPHKPDIPLAPKHHRKNIVKLAIKTNKYFELCDYELNKPGPSYSYQTIEYFKKLYPKDEIYFIIGIDLLEEIHTWKKREKILDYCKFIVGLRPNYSINTIPPRIRARVTFIKIPLIDISSTDIRRKIKNRESIKYLIPDSVISYIIRNKLYR